LFDYISDARESSSAPEKEQEVGEIGDEEEDAWEIAKQTIVTFVREHELNKIVDRFQMRDTLPFGIAAIKRLYVAMQEEMVKEFGAPLAQSLFPAEIFEETPMNSDFTSQDLPSSQRRSYNFD
jgi:hypothetical protein